MTENWSLTVQKHGQWVELSCCQMTELSGENVCKHPPNRVKIPFRRRIRWAIVNLWYSHAPHVHFGPCNHDNCI